MSSYGRPPSAEYDGYDPYSEYEDTYAVESPTASPTRSPRDPYPPDSYAGRQPARGAARATASVGTAGRARVSPPTGAPSSPSPAVSQPSVSPAEPHEGDAPRPRYDWARGGRTKGVATVPVSPAGPVTGRATVRPGGPAGPAGTGPGAPKPARKKKRHWFRNTVLIMLAVMVISVGGGMVALSYYVDSVPPVSELALDQGSTIYFGNGDRMATLQEVNREIIDTTVPELETVRNAVVAAEDKNFYAHSGVDFMGIVRAAFNNTTGSGPQSGASTIDMQYTRAAAGLTEDSYARKLEEAARAYKLNQNYSKDEILDFYLNQVYFGRGAYGVQAAARAYFDKPAAQLSVAEAAMLGGVIRFPADGSVESGLSPYDPRHESNQENPQIALDRWTYVLDQMVDTGALPAAERAQLVELPETIEPRSPDEPLNGRNGHVVQQVLYELEEMNITDVYTGGYRITTTIDRDVQRAALEAARRRNSEAAHWQGMPDNVQSALVAIDPQTGGVLAYWGGNDRGTGIDYAGPNRDSETGEWVPSGWPPGSSAKIYTLMAALEDGLSFDTHWKTTPYTPPWRETPINNAGRGAATSCEGTAPDFCTLRWSTQNSFNIPFVDYSAAVPDSQGPARIVEAARAAGVERMVGTTLDEDGNPIEVLVNLDELDPGDVTEYFFHEVAIGQYPITPLEHANGVATLAARGVYNEAHFVETVEKRNEETGEWEPINGARVAGEQRIRTEHADAITQVLTAVPGMNNVPLEAGRPAAAKTGTWEHVTNGEIDGNGDAWVVGYTPQIAATVWVGDPERKPIVDAFGNAIGSSGLPAQIWKAFMDAAHAARQFDPQPFPAANPVGDPNHEWATGEQPPQGPACLFPFFGCDEGGGNDNRGGGNDDGGDTALPPPPDGETDQDTDDDGGGG